MAAARARIPGPAGGISWSDPSSSAPRALAGGQRDCGFAGGPWLAALHMLDLEHFDGAHPLLQDNVAKANSLPSSGTLQTLLALVVSVQRTHFGEALIRLKDPTGSIAGTLTAGVLDLEPDIAKGSVLLLRKVVLLRTPPPNPVNHLCIRAENVAQVIPAGLPAGSRADDDFLSLQAAPRAGPGLLFLQEPPLALRQGSALPPSLQPNSAVQLPSHEPRVAMAPGEPPQDPWQHRQQQSQLATALAVEPSQEWQQQRLQQQEQQRQRQQAAAGAAHASEQSAGQRRAEPLYVAAADPDDDGIDDLLAGLDDD